MERRDPEREGELKAKTGPPTCFGTCTTQDTCLQCSWNSECSDATGFLMMRRESEKVKAITFILTLPCGPARNEKWAERTSWELVRPLPRGATVKWMWELDKEAES